MGGQKIGKQDTTFEGEPRSFSAYVFFILRGSAEVARVRYLPQLSFNYILLYEIVCIASGLVLGLSFGTT